MKKLSRRNESTMAGMAISGDASVVVLSLTVAVAVAVAVVVAVVEAVAVDNEDGVR